MLALAGAFQLACTRTSPESPLALKEWERDMVYVPAGPFVMGSNVGDADESPQRQATTGAYFIDRHEITNEEFKKFKSDFKFKSGREKFPAEVNWFLASEYASWSGKRLPTEAEWEKAARGTDGRLFPWGNTFDYSFVNWDENDPPASAPARPASPYGCYDMAGSVWEWTADWYLPYPGNSIPSEAYGEKYKVIRGGAGFNDIAMLMASHRYYLDPHTRGNHRVGFRCVKDSN